MKAKSKTLLHLMLPVIVLVAVAGCDQGIISQYRFLQPDKPIAKPDQAEVSWIIDTMSDLDKSSDLFPNSVKPGPQDWIYGDVDYVIGATDVLDISVLDLYAEGLETLLRREVSDSGYIDLPQLKKRIKAEGQTQIQLTKSIEKTYQEHGILKEPVISVTIAARRQQMFSILGSVMRPGTYNLVRRDMRLLEALALAGGIAQSNIDYIYVIRQARPTRKSEVQAKPKQAPKVKAPAARNTPGNELKDMDRLMNGPVASAPALSYSETSTGPVAGQPAAAPAAAPAKKSHRWVYRNGKWVKEAVAATAVPKAATAATVVPKVAPPVPARPRKPVVELPAIKMPDTKALPQLAPRGKAKSDDPFGWGKIAKEDLVRVIAINRKQLEQGDYRMNIVIRENDIIQIPSLEIGEFYIMGEVLRPGVYSLTGRKITIKMAVAAAGNLGPLAWPANSVLIRRIGKNQEQIIPINIDKILRGTDPDIYLKANDVIAVGTHVVSSFLAVIRNAFRMTYGFGFIYDRNFADPMYNYPNSRRFKGW
ncbi:MAG: SLBB domain-containing protein [Phycisphaerae bacterium]|nr:SLBB domain-containing protein [Phycisphaerae bacterium]